MRPPLFVTILTAAALATDLRQADSLHALGTPQSVQQAIDLYSAALTRDSSNYEAAYKCAWACRDFADIAKKRGNSNWRSISATYGKRSMSYADHTVQIDPSRPEAHFWGAVAAGVYAEGVSVVTAVREGLKERLEKSAYEAYRIDRKYLDAGPPFLLGCYWNGLPWPLADKAKALRYYEEYLQSTTLTVYRDQRLYYVGRLFAEMRDEALRQRGLGFLREAARSSDKWVCARAREALASLDSSR